MKKILERTANGFCYSIAITMVIQLLVMVTTDPVPMLPEFMNRFDSQLCAYAVQLLLIGLMSGITSAGTVVFEFKKIGLLIQSILFLIIMLSAWIPVSCFVWGFHRYTMSMVTTVCSIVVTYGICWGINYKLCRRDIEAINAKLSEKRGK